MKRFVGVVAAAAMFAGTLAVATDGLAAGHGGGLGSGHSTHRLHRFAHAATMPYGPEYGFLAHVPPNAMRMPGYTYATHAQHQTDDPAQVSVRMPRLQHVGDAALKTGALMLRQQFAGALDSVFVCFSQISSHICHSRSVVISFKRLAAALS